MPCVAARARARADGCTAARARADALGEQAELPGAIALLERALALDPQSVSLRWSIASQLCNLGLHREALRYEREALALDPTDWRHHSMLLLELQYDTSLASRRELATAHWQWAATHTHHLPKVPPSSRAPREPGRGRLRVGYVSPRFGSGPLANFFLPVLEAHDREQLHVTLYSAYRHEDAAAQKMRSACDAWRDLPEDDDEAAALIAADGLDLLVDLAGHAPGHRLPVLARKPAPVQATWLDCFDTTGLPESTTPQRIRCTRRHWRPNTFASGSSGCRIAGSCTGRSSRRNPRCHLDARTAS